MNKGSKRESEHINYRPAVNLHHATRFSEAINLPLNEFATINYSHTACSLDDASERFRKMIKERFARWLKRMAKRGRIIPPTYVWTFENRGGETAVHWLIHIPEDLKNEFRRLLPRWIEETAGPDRTGTAIKCKPIFNLIGLRLYILKGVKKGDAASLGVTHVPQGKIIGKRSGFSRNLGPAVWRPSEYKPMRRSSSGGFYRPSSAITKAPVSSPPAVRTVPTPLPQPQLKDRSHPPASDPSACRSGDSELDNFLAQAQIYPGFPTAAEQIAKNYNEAEFLEFLGRCHG